VVIPSVKLRITGHRFRASRALANPDMGYGENRGKKKRLSEEKAVGEMFGGGGGWGGGGGRGGRGERGGGEGHACVHAPFDLPPIA
jgi:hypothetical protein